MLLLSKLSTIASGYFKHANKYPMCGDDKYETSSLTGYFFFWATDRKRPYWSTANTSRTKLWLTLIAIIFQALYCIDINAKVSIKRLYEYVLAFCCEMGSPLKKTPNWLLSQHRTACHFYIYIYTLSTIWLMNWIPSNLWIMTYPSHGVSEYKWQLCYQLTAKSLSNLGYHKFCNVLLHFCAKR